MSRTVQATPVRPALLALVALTGASGRASWLRARPQTSTWQFSSCTVLK